MSDDQKDLLARLGSRARDIAVLFALIGSVLWLLADNTRVRRTVADMAGAQELAAELRELRELIEAERVRSIAEDDELRILRTPEDCPQ